MVSDNDKLKSQSVSEPVRTQDGGTGNISNSTDSSHSDDPGDSVRFRFLEDEECLDRWTNEGGR